LTSYQQEIVWVTFWHAVEAVTLNCVTVTEASICSNADCSADYFVRLIFL